MTVSAVFTVGHSTHSIDRFLALLRHQSITAIADVRSYPFSRFNPQYNVDNLKRSLRSHGIRYVFLGRELGARSDDPSCYQNGKVQYDVLARTQLFQSGLERVLQGSKSYRVALMCAEKEPLACHRTLLIAEALQKRDAEVLHILGDGSVEPHERTLSRLFSLLGMPDSDLFRSRQELLAEAKAAQVSRIAYVQKEHEQAAP